MYDGTFGLDSHCSEQGQFKITSETVMNVCATYHVATLEWLRACEVHNQQSAPWSYIQSSKCPFLHLWGMENGWSLCHGSSSLFVHKLVLVTTKDSAPLLLAAQTLQFQKMGDKIKGILVALRSIVFVFCEIT